MIALARHLADSTIFALAVWILCLCMRRRGPAARHTLWLIAVAKFVLPMALFSWLGESLHRLLPAHVSAGMPAALSRWMIPPATPATPNAPTTSSFHSLIVIWLLGSAVAFALWLPKLWIPRRSSRRPSDHAGGLDETSLLRLKGQIGLQRDIDLKFSDEVSEPVLAGFRRPVAMIPTGLDRDLAPAELESVILHELAHAKRWDNWTAAFAHAVSCIFWFYPLLWWIERRLRSERELACDEMVIRCGAAPEDYTAGILKVCRFHLGEDVAGISGVSGSNLKHRLEAIMSVSSEGRFARAPKVLVGGLITAIVGIPLVIGFATASNARAYPTDRSGEQSATKQSKSQKPITCAWASVDYPEGTVIQVGHGVEQMCARVLDPASAKDLEAPPTYYPQWIHTSEAIRERSTAVVHPPESPVVDCAPKAPDQKGLCSCEDGGPNSPGAIVNSAKGQFQLRCGFDGNWVQTKTPNIKRK